MSLIWNLAHSRFEFFSDLKNAVSFTSRHISMAQEIWKSATEFAELVAILYFFSAVTLGKLEALRVSNEGVIENLRSQITNLQQKLHQLETEQETLLSSQRSSSEQHNTRLKVLERVSDPITTLSVSPKCTHTLWVHVLALCTGIDFHKPSTHYMSLSHTHCIHRAITSAYLK